MQLSSSSIEQKAAHLLPLLLLSLLAAGRVDGFPRGPPAFACLNGQPMHGTMQGSVMVLFPPYTQSILYSLNTNSSTWTPGQVVEVKLLSRTTSPFKGFVLRAVRATSMYSDMNLGPLLGSFQCNSSANATMRYVTIYSPTNESNCVTHAEPKPMTELTCHWTPPATNEGPIMFMATGVERGNKYQYVMSPVLNSTLGMPANSDGSGVMSSDPSQFGCGTTKLCLLYPPLCDSRASCTHGVMMTRQSGGNVLIEMFGSSIDWLGLGIGKSENMESMELHVCTYDKNRQMVTLETAYSPNKAVVAVHRPMLRNRQGMIRYNQSSSAIPPQPTMLACSFVRPETDVYTMYGFNRSSFRNTIMQMESKLDDGNYVVLAQGSSIGGDSKMTAQHAHRPMKSPIMVRVSQPVKLYFNGLSTLVQTHATLMTVFWLFLVGLAIVIARHSRPVFNQEIFMHKMVWFLLHIGLTLIGYITAIAGIIFMLVRAGRWSESSQTHGIIGLISMGLALINILAGLFRPSPDSKRRWIFNRLHRYNGLLALLFATIAMWLGATYYNNRPEFVFWAVIVLAVWTGVQLLFMIIFEWRRQTTAANETFKQSIENKYKMSNIVNGGQQQQQQQEEEEPEEPQQPVKGKTVKHVTAGLIYLYGAVIFAICAAFWAGLWLH